MAERGVSLDHSTIARWVLRYAPILSQRIRCKMRKPNRSWRVDETYIRVAGKWAYLYRAVDSEGDTIDFMLSPNRDLTAAKHFLQLALWRTREVWPRVINVDGHPAYARAIAELKSSGELGWRCRCRRCPYLNNIVEQDHCFIKKAHRGEPLVPFGGGRTTDRCWLRAIRKGQIRWLPKGDVVGQVQFIQRILSMSLDHQSRWFDRDLSTLFATDPIFSPSGLSSPGTAVTTMGIDYRKLAIVRSATQRPNEDDVKLASAVELSSGRR